MGFGSGFVGMGCGFDLWLLYFGDLVTDGTLFLVGVPPPPATRCLHQWTW